jgi:hypothetical protein
MTLAVVRGWCYTCGMKIISKIACTVLALGVTACSKEPTGETSYKGDFKVSKLFVQDACTVYRFEDAGQFVYFTKCENAASSSAIPVESCGKMCTRADSNETKYH